MPAAPKVGPNSQQELEALWSSVTDPGYSRGLQEAGEGRGYEAITQALAQHARLSLAIDRTTQSLFIKRWSGQSDDPATGARFALVTLAISRSKLFERTVTIAAGDVLVEEETTDASPEGPVTVHPGRRYVALETATLGPGETELEQLFVAERAGRSFDEPPPGEVRAFVQPGAGFNNVGASVVVGVTEHRLEVANVPHVVVPQHVGQYVELVAGANAGAVRRVVGYEPPDLSALPPTGGTALLAATAVLRASAIAGTFEVGEVVQQAVSLAEGLFVHQTATHVVVERTLGTFVAGQVLTGLTSGATAAIDAVDQDPDLIAEAGTAAWRILRWGDDLGISATNAEAPSGGRLAVLDELGAERLVPRSPGEGDEPYRKRVVAAPDVVTPRAVLRAANRVLAPYGLAARLREVGGPGLPGILVDAAPNAYNLDFVALNAVVVGEFFDGEVVEQLGPTIARGLAVTTRPVGLGPVGASSLLGVARVRGTFAAGTATGLASGAVATIASVSGGLEERDRYKLLLDYASFRAFFLLGIPPSDLGDFGFAYDTGDSGGFDSPPYVLAFDGYATLTAALSGAVWRGVDAARAGGVGFEVVTEYGGP